MIATFLLASSVTVTLPDAVKVTGTEMTVGAIATVTGNEVSVPIGHFNVFPLEPERTFAIVSEQTQRIAATGARLLAIGGDYSVSPAIVRGLTQQLGADDLALIRVSRRVDLQRVPPQGTSGPTRHCATTDIASHLRGGLACVALLGARGTISAEEQQRAGAANVSGATEVVTAPGQAAAAAVGALARLAGRFYLSVDIDVLAPRFGAVALPATRGGLTLTQLHEVLTSFTGLTFVGAELTGHVPDLDVPGRAVSAEIAGLGAAMLQLLMANKAHSAKPGP